MADIAGIRPDALVAHTFTMGELRRKRGWIDNDGTYCEGDLRCKQPTVVHYQANEIDKWLCRVHYDRLLKKLFGSKHDDS